MMTLNEFLQQALHKQQLPDADFIYLLEDIADACKQVAKAVSHGALTGNMGSLETENLHGDTQKQLDVIANDIFLQVNEANGHFAGMASEEMDDPYEIPEQYRKHGKYLLLFDPLDGSSNVNLNFTVGSIFSILRQPVAGTSPVLADYLQPGTQQLCAGYALYGSSTMLVFTTGHGVNGFTLNTDTGHFVLTHADMRIPAESSEFAINMSRQKLWQPPVQRYVEECLQGKSGPRGKAFNMRWVASMVAEVHRILIRGGVFMYPLDSELQGKGGRLRLMYEANPMSFIVEQAGGMASTGYQRILESQPKDLHQRTPVILGSTDEVELLIRYHCSD